MPFQVDLSAKKESLTLSFENINFQSGLYQIYIDVGNKLKGPYEFSYKPNKY